VKQRQIDKWSRSGTIPSGERKTYAWVREGGGGGHRIEYVPTPEPNPQWPDLDHNHTHFFFVKSSQSDDHSAATIRLWKDFEDALKEKVYYYDQIKQWFKRHSTNGTHAATYVVTKGANDADGNRAAKDENGDFQIFLNASRLPLSNSGLSASSTIPKGAAKIWKDDTAIDCPKLRIITNAPVDILKSEYTHGKVRQSNCSCDATGRKAHKDNCMFDVELKTGKTVKVEKQYLRIR
jgi:hypothetical protein